jgi:hypothetical protein
MMRKRDTITIVIDPTKPYVYNMRHEGKGWPLVSEIEYEAGEVTLELAEFLHMDETRVDGAEMRRRAKKIGANLGQRHAEAILVSRHRIPEGWGRFQLTFPGTVRRSPSGLLFVPCLFQLGKSWEMIFENLESNWYLFDRLLRPRK